MPKPIWPRRVVKKDPDPEEFGDPSLELTRVVLAPDGAALFAARCWDLDEFDAAHSVLFRARDFAKPADRLCAVGQQIMDIGLRGEALWVLTEGSLHAFSLVELSKPAASIPLEGQSQRALAILDNGEQYVVGNGVEWFDGQRWRRLAGSDSGLELRAIAAIGDEAIAVGARGTIVSLRGGAISRIDSGTEAELHGVRVDDRGALWIAGARGTRLCGKRDALRALPSALAADFNASCERRGEVYWSAASDDGGLYRDRGATLERVFDEVCFELSATDAAIYASSAGFAVRYDGADVPALALAVEHDEESSQWVAAPFDAAEP